MTRYRNEHFQGNLLSCKEEIFWYETIASRKNLLNCYGTLPSYLMPHVNELGNVVNFSLDNDLEFVLKYHHF